MVDNRGGAGGAIGAEAAAKSAADGYTIVLGSTGTFLVSPRMTGGEPPYTLASFAPVALLSISPMDIVVNAANPIKDWAGMLAALRAQPGIPTFAELGAKDFAATTPLMLMAPAGTPPEIVKKLNEAVADSLADPLVKDRLSELGSETQAMTPDAVAAFMKNENATIEELSRSGLLKVE